MSVFAFQLDRQLDSQTLNINNLVSFGPFETPFGMLTKNIVMYQPRKLHKHMTPSSSSNQVKFKRVENRGLG